MWFYIFIGIIVASLALVMKTEISWIKQGRRKQAMFLVGGYTLFLAVLWFFLTMLIAQG